MSTGATYDTISLVLLENSDRKSLEERRKHLKCIFFLNDHTAPNLKDFLIVIMK